MRNGHLMLGRILNKISLTQPYAGFESKIDAAFYLSLTTEVQSGSLKKLSGDRAGQYSIRINDQWRICFEWHEGDAYNIEITDYH